MDSGDVSAPAGRETVSALDSPIFLGVDVAGADNTWVAGITRTASGARLTLSPRSTSLREIVEFADTHDVVAVAIDAQLSVGVSEERGFRASDEALRRLLPSRARSWVASFNSLMAVPVRGQMLADALGPAVGTIIETHPRACLHFAFGGRLDAEITAYKDPRGTTENTRQILNRWTTDFGIQVADVPLADGAVDSIVCATIAMLYHTEPHRLLRLRDRGMDRRGRGPFWVLNPRQSDYLATNADDSLNVPATPVASTPTRGASVSGVSPVELAADGASASYADVVGRPLRCPACAEFEFAQWPYGWDAHAGHSCSGLDGEEPEERKRVFRERFRTLFRHG